MEKTIEELKAEIESKKSFASKAWDEVKVLEAELKARTNYNTKDYIGKYIHISDNGGTNIYMYVTSAEDHYWDADWHLTGPGFLVYEKKGTGRIKFETEPYSVSINDINNGYSKCEFITADEFYSIRESYMKKIIDERYV